MNDKRLKGFVERKGDGIAVNGWTITKAVPFQFEGECYAVNPNAILTINCTSKCNANCFFCYNASTFMRDKEYVPSVAPELLRVLRFARCANIQTAALSGGEPTLQPEALIQLTQTVARYAFPIIRLHTNGAFLGKPVCFEGEVLPLWKHLENAGLRDVSISAADFRRQQNMDIMNTDTLPFITAYLPAIINSGLHVRLSCYLCPQGIYTAEEVQGYLRFWQTYGVASFIFRLSPFPGASAYLEQLTASFCESGWRICFQQKKDNAIIYELARGEERMSFSCTREETDPDQKIRRLIFMPDLVTYTSWIDQSSYLFEDDGARLVAAASEVSGPRDGYPAAKWNVFIPAYITQDSGQTIDLHVHSQVSDGLLAPTEVLQQAASAGIQVLSFAEHNCVHDSPEHLKEAARKLGIEIAFFAVEASTVYCRQGAPFMKFHLLIYAEQAEQLDFLRTQYDPNQPRNDYIRKLYQNAFDHGAVNIPLEEIYRINDPDAPTKKKMLTRSPLARAIAECCGCTEQEAKDMWLPSMPDTLRYQTYLDIAEMIRMAHESGCATVLAHPCWVRPYHRGDVPTEQDLFLVVADLARSGLDGIELSHRLNPLEMRPKLFRLAATLGLIPTGGSDFHGKPRCVFGVNGTVRENLELLQARVRCLRQKAGR